MVNRLYAAAFREFSLWADAFSETFKEGGVCLYAHVGDSFALVEALEEKEKRGTCTVIPDGQLEILQLEEGVPRVFDAVDTSNLSDSCGLIHVLLAFVRVLDTSRPHSVLFTELMATDKESASGEGREGILEQLLFMPLSAFSVLTGLMLCGEHSLSTTTFSTPMEMAMQCFSETDPPVIMKSFRWSLFPFSQGSLQGDSERGGDQPQKKRMRMKEGDFVCLLTDVYKRMMSPSLNPFDDRSRQKGQNSFALPNPYSFVKLLHRIAQHIELFNSSVYRLYSSLEEIRELSLLHGNVCQEMYAWMMLLGVVSSELHRDTQSNKYPYPQNVGPNPPLLVHLSLTVPRSALSRLDNFTGPTSATLMMSVTSPVTNNQFRSIHVALVRSDSQSPSNSSVPQQQQRDVPADLDTFEFAIVSAIVPASCLSVAPASSILVDLNIPPKSPVLTTGPSVMRSATAQFGLKLCVFSAPLSDREKVSWQPLSVGTEGEGGWASLSYLLSDRPAESSPELEFSGRNPTSIIERVKGGGGGGGGEW